MNMLIGLIILALMLIGFGVSQAILHRSPLVDAPLWLGIIIPLGIVIGLRNVPTPQRSTWVLVAVGWLFGVVAHVIGFNWVSIIVLVGAGTGALAVIGIRRREMLDQNRAAAFSMWAVLAVVIVTLLILFWLRS
jgi:apolipoprotein N-acyltransferase